MDRWSRREFLRRTALAGTAALVRLAPARASAQPRSPSLPVSGKSRLVAAIEMRNGVPQMVVNGKVEAPFLFFHGSVAGTTPATAEIGAEWREHGFSFTAPVTDDNAAVHVRTGSDRGTLWIDDVRLFEVQGSAPGDRNLLGNPDFEEGSEPGSRWSLFVAPRAKASASIDARTAASGRASLKLVVENPGTEVGHVHLYQSGLRIEQGKIYTFKIKLRSDVAKKVEILAAHQGPPWTLYGGSNHAVEQIELSREAGFHLRTFDMALPWPRKGTSADYHAGDLEVRAHLALDPKALLVPRLHTDAPRWWKEQHPDHVMLYEDGRHQMVSVASKAWRRDAGEALRLFVHHLEEAFGDHILGYHVGAQNAGEWFYERSWTPPLPNFEMPFRDGFRAWLKTKYRTQAALRAAWHDPRADFPSVGLPSALERREGGDGTFRAPKTQRAVIDFFEYSQVAMVEALEHFARVVKAAVRGRKLVFAFYGYLFEVAGFGNGPQVSGHLLTDRVARCPDIDVLCAPIAYFDREAGGSAPFMAPVDSIQRRGKLWLNEDDTRTHLSAESEGSGRVDTLTATRWVHQRNFAQVLAHRCGLWWMDLPAGGWLASSELWDNFAALRELWRAEPDRPLRPDVAVLVDERSSLYLPCNDILTTPLLAQLRYHIHRTGVSVGYYLLEDLGAGLVPEAKVYLLLNAFVISPEQRQAIHRAVRNQGKWAVWFYAPGYLDPTGRGGDMSALTGVRLQRLPKPQALRVTMVPGSFATSRVPADQLTFGEDTPRSPAFTVVDEAEEPAVLGYYARTQTPAVACVRRSEWSSVFVGSTTISTGVLRSIARAAGAHVWLETDDVVIAGSDVMALHASTAGEKEILVPAGAAITDVSTGTASHVGRVKVAMRRGETKLFRLTPP